MVALMVAFTSYHFFPNTPHVEPTLRLSEVTVHKPTPQLHYEYQSYYHIPAHYASLHFNLSLDLRPAFHWNTKQIYAYLTLTYATQEYETNAIVFWDSVISEYDDALIELDLNQNKYAIHDVLFRRAQRLVGRSANITLAWCISPHVGYVYKVPPTLHIPIQFVEEPSDKK